MNLPASLSKGPIFLDTDMQQNKNDDATEKSVNMQFVAFLFRYAVATIIQHYHYKKHPDLCKIFICS